MFARTFILKRFLRCAYGTEPFLEYCQSRRITFGQQAGAPMGEQDLPRWAAALARLSAPERARVQLELSQVNELSHPETVSLLLDAVPLNRLPPDLIAADTALALWFFLHHPD